ncbi:MAG: hypothetical protein WCT23_08710, partial [Candidatus Neomarinimicrobiota bacterium]
MKSKKFKTILILLCCLATSKGFAGYGYYADAFIVAGRSAQSIAMGGTGLTSIDGVASLFSNSAGLASSEKNEFYTQFNNLYGLAFQNSLAYSSSFGEYRFGIALNTVGAQLHYRDDILSEIPNINDRREYIRSLLLDEADSFYDLENALLLTFAGELPFDIKTGWSFDRVNLCLQYGLTAKVIYKNLANESAMGGGMDAGLRLFVPGSDIFNIRKMGDLVLALNIENFIQSPVIWFNGKWADQGNMRMSGAIALHQDIPSLSSEVRLIMEGYIFENQLFPGYGTRFGLQWRLNNKIDFRLGKDLSSFTGGLGVFLP